jgi:hypothetical protein
MVRYCGRSRLPRSAKDSSCTLNIYGYRNSNNPLHALFSIAISHTEHSLFCGSRACLYTAPALTLFAVTVSRTMNRTHATPPDSPGDGRERTVGR